MDEMTRLYLGFQCLCLSMGIPLLLVGLFGSSTLLTKGRIRHFGDEDNVRRMIVLLGIAIILIGIFFRTFFQL